MSAVSVGWLGSRQSRALAWGLALVGVLGYAGLVLLAFADTGWSGFGAALLQGAPLVLFFVFLGALLALRQPGNPIGWLLIAGGLTWLLTAVAADYATYVLAHGQVTVAARLAANFNYSAWPIGALCSVGLPLLLFPAGRLRSPKWRWVLGAMVLGCVLVLISGSVSTEPVVLPGTPPVDLVNPWGVEALAPFSSVGRGLGVLLVMVTSLIAVVGIALRFRSARGSERQQLRWVRAGAALAIAGMVSHPLSTQLLHLPSALTETITAVGIGCLPVSLTVAVLRYRLYDLDRIVSRTVAYASVTGLLVAIYFAMVAAVSQLTPSGSSLAVAASTLAVAALFQPLRRRVQRVVDRRFNRARYDADRTVEAFSRKLREQVDLDVVRTDLLAVACQTMQPTSATLWLRNPTGASS